VFKRFRIAILLYILLFVAVGQYLAGKRSTDWNNSLWVDIYPVNVSGSAETEAYLDSLKPDEFAAVATFFAEQARAYGVTLEQPFQVRLAGQLENAPPALPADGGMLSIVLWSLKMRWFTTRLHWASDDPTPDITFFALYHDGNYGSTLDRSTALRKGMIAIGNLFADRHSRGSNQMIVAHELLHTLGATDKYDLGSTLPILPIGFAEPDLSPLYPQRRAELMGGRIPVGPREAVIPDSLREVVVGPATALEIGWIDELPQGY